MLKFLAKLELWIGISLLAIIVILVFAAAVARSFGYPIIWSVDMAQLLFIWLCFIGASRAIREHAILGVDVFVSRLPNRVRLYIELVLAVIIIAFLTLLIYFGIKLTFSNIERIYGDSGISYGFVTVAVPLGSALLALSVLANLIVAWQGRHSAETLIFSRNSNEISQQ